MPSEVTHWPVMQRGVLLSPRAGGSLVLRWVVLPYLYVSLLFYVVVQFQEAVFGQIFVVHQHIRIVGLVGAFVAAAAYVLRRRKVRVRRPRLLLLSIAYCGFVLFDFGLKLARGNVRSAAAVYGETYLYFFALLIPLMIVMSDNESLGPTVLIERGAFRTIYLIAIPIFLLGYAQVLFNKPILTLGDEAAGYVVQVPTRTDISQVRAFSVFGSGFTYGHFITLVGALATAYLVLRRRGVKRLVFAALLAAAALAAASTMTRNTYLEFVVSVGAIVLIPWAMRRWATNGVVVGASAVFAAMMYGLMIGFFVLTHVHARGLLSASTFEIRLVGVAAVLARYILGASGSMTVLFGQGYIQGEKFAELQGIHPLLFDNTYVDVALFSGIVGLLFFLLFFVALFRYCLERFRQTGAYWWLALSGMYFSYPLVSCLNINTSALYLITSVVIAYDIMARRGQRNDPRTNAPLIVEKA